MTGWQDGVQLVQIARGISSRDVCAAVEKQGNRETGETGGAAGFQAGKQGVAGSASGALGGLGGGAGICTGWSRDGHTGYAHGVSTQGAVLLSQRRS